MRVTSFIVTTSCLEMIFEIFEHKRLSLTKFRSDSMNWTLTVGLVIYRSESRENSVSSCGSSLYRFSRFIWLSLPLLLVNHCHRSCCITVSFLVQITDYSPQLTSGWQYTQFVNLDIYCYNKIANFQYSSQRPF